MGNIIEGEKKITHMKLAERVEAKLDDQKFLKSQKLGSDVRLFRNSKLILVRSRSVGMGIYSHRSKWRSLRSPSISLIR